jgi:hypothetical protein
VDSWRTINGVDWLCTDRGAAGSAPGELGVLLAHGYAHESPAELGIGAAAAFVLARELARPRETADHGVVQLEIATEVNLQDTVILMTGGAEALRLGLIALDGLLRDPRSLNVTGLPNPRRFAWTGWSNELNAWVGMGPAALAAETDEPWSGDPAELERFVRRLDPRQGKRTIVWTTDAELVGAAFTDPPTSSVVDDRPLTWRETTPTGSAGSVTSTYNNNLLTARVPSNRANEIALRLLARTVHRSLVEFTQLVASLQFTVEQIGTDTLFAVRAVPHDGPTDWFAVGNALLQAVEASAAFPDTILAEEIEKSRSPESIGFDLAPTGRAINAMRSGTRPTPGELWNELDTMTVAELRQGTQLVRTSSLFGVPPGVAAPPERPLWQPPVLPPIARPEVTRRSLVRLPAAAGPSRQVVRATSTTLQKTVKPQRKTSHALSAGPTTTLVDLTAVVARIDSGDTWTTLVDRENRRLTLAWPAYLRAAPLRALVDAAAPPRRRMALRVDPSLTADLHTQLRKWRTGLIVQLLVVILVVVLLIWQPVTGKTYQHPVVTVVPIGSTVTLGNGSTVRVSGARWRMAENRGRQYVVADVRYCGGGVTVDRNTAEDARNYVTPERFGVNGIAPASRAFLPLTNGEIALHSTSLAQGQCAEGKIGFEVDAAKPPAGARISYYNGSGDKLEWSLD